VSVRKPAGVSWESWADRQIREAQERGEFDDLPGAGKPLPDLHQPYDELWWVRKKLREEGLAYVPPGLQLRRAVEQARQEIASARSEQQVRRIVAEVNGLIRRANRTGSAGGPVGTMPLDEEQAVRDWRAARPDAGT
jgi:hypothetical protein